jgi:hypothetical protein
MKAAATVLAAFIVATPAAAQAPAWQPDVAAATAYASHRHGTIAFAVRTESSSWGWHASRTFRLGLGHGAGSITRSPC